MRTSSLTRRHLGTLAFLCLGISTAIHPAQAQVFVDATVTPLGGSFRYDVSVFNTAVEDLAIVSLVNAPVGDPLIDPTLIAPVGFLGSYDGGLGFIDFLGDADVFATGTTVNGFSFESLSPPGPDYLTLFEALDVTGGSYAGNVRFNPGTHIIPETSTITAVLGLLACAGWQFTRRWRTHFQS